MEFTREYQQCPPSEEHYRLAELADEYHRRCEEFDKTVCSGCKNGVAMPMNGKELGLVGRNAKQMLKEIANRERVAESLLLDYIRHSRPVPSANLPRSAHKAVREAPRG